MSGYTLLTEHRTGEVRAALLDEKARPIRVFIDRASTRAARAYPGRVLDARVRERETGGVFLTLETGADAFWRLPAGTECPPQGRALRVRVEAEARRDKLARVSAAPPGANRSDPPDAINAFIASLSPTKGVAKGDNRVSEKGVKGAQKGELSGIESGLVRRDAETRADREAVAQAFEALLASEASLTGGGRLTVERTRALTVFDIDSHGRTGRGGPAALARTLNREAVAEAGRQMALRELGGLAVIDCVAPVARGDGETLRAGFVAAVRAATDRAAMVLLPSRLGLIEASLPWGFQPPQEVLCDARGELTPETLALEGLAALEREAMADRGGMFRLALPATALDWLRQCPFDWHAALAGQIGARFDLDPAPAARILVSPR